MWFTVFVYRTHFEVVRVGMVRVIPRMMVGSVIMTSLLLAFEVTLCEFPTAVSS